MTRSTPLPSAVCELLRIRPGQSQMVHWPAGTVVTPLRGGVWLSEAPRWLGGQLLRPRHRIEAHATQVMADTGWVVIWAEHEAVLQVRHLAPGWAGASGFETVLQAARVLLAGAWRRARQRFGSARPA